MILFDQDELNDFKRDLNLLKDKVELLGSRLKKMNLLNENVRLSYCNREKDLAKFLCDKDGFIYCIDVNKLMKAVGHKYIASEWRLFLDSNKTTLEGVLLQNDNEFPSIAVVYASHLRKSATKL